MTEGIALPKWEHLNLWPIWIMKNFMKKQRKIQLNLEEKNWNKHMGIQGKTKS